MTELNIRFTPEQYHYLNSKKRQTGEPIARIIRNIITAEMNRLIAKGKDRIIIEKISESYNVEITEMLSISRKQEYAYARFACMHFLKRYTDYSPAKIGNLLGRDRTTVLSGLDTYDILIGGYDKVSKHYRLLDVELTEYFNDLFYSK